MIINKDIIDEYIDYLSSAHDAIVSEIQLSSSRLSKKIAHKICTFLNDKSHLEKYLIILPNENEIKDKIINTIKHYYFSAIKDIENFIKRQNNSLDLCINGDDLGINVEHLLCNLNLLENNGDIAPVPTNEIIDQIITHINFKNINNKDFIYYKNIVETNVKETTPYLLNEGIEEFEKTKKGYKERLSSKTYSFSNSFSKININNSSIKTK